MTGPGTFETCQRPTRTSGYRSERAARNGIRKCSGFPICSHGVMGAGLL